MTTVFEGTPTFIGINGGQVHVSMLACLVFIRTIDVIAEEAVTIAMRPDQARALAAGILDAAEQAEADQ